MVTPYMDHDLAGLLENPSVRLKVPHIKSYMKQLLQGTAYLHDVSCLHFIIDILDEDFTSRYESCQPLDQ
jgi:serine/threonine protein kinase